MELPIIHPSHSHWKRADMPQIPDVPEFEAYLKQHGITFHRADRSAYHLLATQNEINLKLVFKLISAGLNTKAHPLVISYDGHILDGHNRWYAALILRIPVHCLLVEREIESLLHIALTMPEVKHSSIATTKTK